MINTCLRAILSLCCFAALLHSLSAQDKNDFVWLLGTPASGNPDPYYAGNYIDFINGNPSYTPIDLPLDMWYPNIMSDESGSLSFYNNGCEVRNAEHQLIENGDEINEGFIHETYCHYPNHPVGYPSYQGHLTLPYPGHEGEYFLFHTWVDEEYLARKLLYTHIDMNANGGKGEVLEKNQLLWQDTFSLALTATRHANGRDWWVVSARDTSSVYYLYLLDPAGIHGPMIQQPDEGWIQGHAITLSNIFSPDGSKFVRVGADTPAAFRMYDFDRCAGILSNPTIVQIPDSVAFPTWTCFSPNSRFLYVQNWAERLYQYDTWASDISASVQLVGVYDGFLGRHDLPTSFNSMMVGPDQRIYMSCANGTNYLHTIHRPDEPGLACDFRQHDVVLPAHFPFYLPNMPFYRLYYVPGSPCDTLGVQAPMVAFWRSEQDSSSAPTAMAFTDISYFQPTSWHWDFGDGTSTTEQSPAHLYPSPGIFEVCLTACNAAGICDTLCRNIEIKVLGTSNPTEAVPFDLYPNPANAYLYIGARNLSRSVELMVYDVHGRKIFEKNTDFAHGVEQLSVQNLPPGMYVLCLRSGDKLWSRKFVKE